MSSPLSKVLSPSRAALLAAAGCMEAVDKFVALKPSVRYSAVGFGIVVLAYCKRRC